MQKPSMKTRRDTKKPEWFRVGNAYVDEDRATGETTPVYIYDEIGDSWWGESTSAAQFIKTVGAITTPNIELHLNSPGGDIFDGVAIYNALKAHPARVTVIVDALAASAASFIAQAGDEVVMTKAATMMIHDGSGLVWGNAADMRATADLLDKLSNTVAEIYSDRAGQNIEFWRNLMIEETWYNSHEAVAAGLADKIGEDTAEEDDKAAQNKWDLSIFNYAGRSSAPDPFVVRQRIANRLKEMTVGKPQNTGTEPQKKEDVQQTDPPVDPPADPDTQQTDPPENEPPVEPPVEPQQPTAQTQTGFTFKVQGQDTADFKAVQNRLDFLEEFRNNTIKSGKQEFVKQLAVDNKIGAPQVEKLTAYALSLTDEQYAAWKDTWDGAVALPMLGETKVGGVSNTGSQSQAVEDNAAELDIKKGILRQHKLSNMTDDQIKQTASYKRVMELDPTFQL